MKMRSVGARDRRCARKETKGRSGKRSGITIRKLGSRFWGGGIALECADNATRARGVCLSIFTHAFRRTFVFLASPIRIFVAPTMFVFSRRKPALLLKTYHRPRSHLVDPLTPQTPPPLEYKFPDRTSLAGGPAASRIDIPAREMISSASHIRHHKRSLVPLR